MYKKLNNYFIISTIIIWGQSTDNKSLSTIADQDEFNNLVLEDNVKKEKKRRRDEVNVEEKNIEKEEYDKILHEQRYKRLMHLLNQSQFYADYLMKKITSTSLEELKDKKDEKSGISNTNENKPPKKGKKKNTQEYDIRQYISPKVNHIYVILGKLNKYEHIINIT